MAWCLVRHRDNFTLLYLSLFLITMPVLLFRTSLPVCTPSFHCAVISSCSHSALGMCEYQFYAVSNANFLHIK
jgi:hypothetical protein